MVLKLTKALVFPALATLVWTAAAAPSLRLQSKKVVSFNKDVRPILSEHCFRCHGPSAKEGKGGLRLDDSASAFKDRRGTAAIVPGSVTKSRIISRITAKDDDDAMPPANSGMNRLTADETAVLKAWIEQGAKYEKHWALIPPVMPVTPVVKNKTWAKNPIDFFVLQKLEDKALAPEPEADKTTLLRRASLTLTGLQPTSLDIDNFLKDKEPGAYERAVDRLLASSRYGEHEARYWLDAVRYGDTHGLHLDNERAIYPYRDWVVRAFNEDLSFDKFALWQLAGDLLPNPTTDQMIATGYVRMNPTSSEGGAIAEEFLARNTFDRVDTTSTVFLGMTVGCARCHSHKYDPISQKDYYQLYAYFNSTADEPLDGNALLPGPTMKAPTPAEAQRMRVMEAGLRTLEANVDVTAAQGWLASRQVESPIVGKWEVSEQVAAGSFDKAFDDDSAGTNWMPFDLKPDANNNFFKKENAYAYVRTTIASKREQDYGLRIGSDDAVKVWVNGKLAHSNKALRSVEQATDVLRIHLSKGDNPILIKVVNATGPGGVRYGLGDELDKKIEDVAKSKDVTALRSLYLLYGSETAASKDYRARTRDYTSFMMSIPETLIARELPKPRPAFVLRRGEYNLPTDQVSRAIPAAFGSVPPTAPANRLGLAQWLTAPNNPLFARVFVNRIWQQHFGTGLVKTSEDFGNQGDWPSHPELLDYLAVKFEKDGYSVKKLNKMIVTSAAFRQRAFVSPAKLKVDPENRLISRGPRFRLDAEVLRDQALFASGLLFEKRGGHGFKPYQPAGLWEEVAFQESTTAKYKQDTTDEIYRRSLYLFWKRTSPHPVMLTFDAPMRESCVVRRARTNTPLQALVTLNEPAFLEASRAFGQRLALQKGSLANKVKLGFRLTTGRDPNPEESKMLSDSYQRYLARYQSDKDAAKSLIKVGMAPLDKSLDPAELAAWTLVCSTLFNLDEFLTQH